MATEPSWAGTVTESATNLEKLRLLCHSESELKSGGYVLQQLSKKQIESKMRCLKCRVRAKPRPALPEAKSGGRQKPQVCVYHPGHVALKTFSCCGQHVSQRGCTTKSEHTLPSSEDPNLHRDWHYHFTTSHVQLSPLAQTFKPGSQDYVPGTVVQSDPVRQQPNPKSKKGQKQHGDLTSSRTSTTPAAAVALDCEMGVTIAGDSELIRLSAVDFFSGKTLVDSLVQPNVAMAHFNTRYSGVSAADMRNAIRDKNVIHGRDQARKKLREFVSPDTVLVVHGGNNDLNALRWIHLLIVDTCILETYTGVKFDGGRSLKNLCRTKLGISVQQKRASRGPGHDSLEDAMACRELCLSWLRQIPGTLDLQVATESKPDDDDEK